MYVKPFVLQSQLFFLCLCLQLQKRKEREEQLEDVIQAYEKIHMEKSNLQRDLDKMVRHHLVHCTVHSCLSSFTVAEAIWLINKCSQLYSAE